MRLLDAIGRRWMLVETVGVGQVEVEIAGKADTTVVVRQPRVGRRVQANKAGLMEIADVFVINKADRKGVEETRRDLEQMLDLCDLPADGWRPPILAAVATAGAGVAELWDAINAHRAERRRAANGSTPSVPPPRGIRDIVAERLHQRAREICTGDRWEALAEAVAAHEPDPWSAADKMLDSASTHDPAAKRGRCHGDVRSWVLANGGTGLDIIKEGAVNDELVPLERHDDGVAVITLNNRKVNALLERVVRRLHVVAQLRRRSARRGCRHRRRADLRRRRRHLRVRRPDEAGTSRAAIHAALDTLAAMPRIVIAAVSGYALGGGCELALACDYRIAGERAVFGQPEILLGIIPGGGGTQRLARLVGASRAKEMCITGRQVKADEALRIGLADEVVPGDEVHARAMAWPPSGPRAGLAQAYAKRAIDGGLERAARQGSAASSRTCSSKSFRTKDSQIGVKSFLEHGPGKAQFTGT